MTATSLAVALAALATVPSTQRPRAEGAAVCASPADALVAGGGGFLAPDLSGSFVEYAPLRGGRARLEATIRLFWIEAELDGVRGPWLEIWLDKLGRSALRIRPSAGSRGQGAGVVLKRSGTFVRLPLATATRAGEPSPACGSGAPPRPRAEGGERPVVVRTASGPFKARRRTLETGAGRVAIWTSPSVPVTGVVRLEGPAGEGWEVVAVGRGATSAFPERFDAAPLPGAAALGRLLGQ